MRTGSRAASHARPAEPAPDDLPAGIGFWLWQRWSAARPWLRTAGAAFRQTLTRGRPLRRPVARWVRRRWPGWPASWKQLVIMALGAFALGAAFALPFALYAGRAPAGVALARAVPASVASPARARLAGTDASPPTAPAAGKPTRGELARQMARESFEVGDPLAGVGYFRIAVRAQRRAPDDDVLILYAIAALSHTRAGAASQRLLRDLGPVARPLLAASAEAHPDRRVRARARALVAPPARRPFLRWTTQQR
jgi:hypothetical protein